MKKIRNMKNNLVLLNITAIIIYFFQLQMPFLNAYIYILYIRNVSFS